MFRKFVKAGMSFAVTLTAALLLFTVVMSDDLVVHAKAAAINSTNIKLYCLDDEDSKFTSMPSSYNTKFQLKVTGASDVQYSVISGYTVTVSSTGLIEPECDIWYWKDGVGTTAYQKDYDYKTTSYYYGKSVVEVTAGSQTFKVNVEVINYGDTLINKKMDDYISKNITSSMTAKKKLEMICKFVSSYDYDNSKYSAKDMILSGGGNCYAINEAVLAMCKKVGIDAWERNGYNDYSDGVGNENIMAKGDGKYYQLNVSYTGNAPRKYDIIERSSLFSTRTDYDGYFEVYQYDGKTMPDKLVVPGTINGKTVEAIGAEFVSDSSVKEVVLPETVKVIKYSAFENCSSLKTLNIPTCVETIGIYAFSGCPALTNFTCSAKNKNYTIDNGVLYNKNKTTVVAVPAAQYAYFAPTVINMEEGAIYGNSNIKTIRFPKGMTSIGYGSVGHGSNLTTVIIPTSITFIDDYAFYYDNSLKNVYYFGSKAQWNAINADSSTNAPLFNASIVYNFDPDTQVIPVSDFKVKARAADALRLKWDANLAADGYMIERYTNGKWERAAKIDKNTTTEYRLAKLSAATTYKFRIKAYKTTNSKTYYSTVSATLSATTSPKNATGFRLKSRASDALRLTWNKSSTADGYIIEKYSGSKWVRVKKITGGSTTEYRISGLKPGTSYKFRIKAYKMVGKAGLYSTVSGAVRATTQPSSVTGFSYKKLSSTSIKTVWSKSASADGYIIEKLSGSKWVQVKKITSKATEAYTISGLTAGGSYKYRIRPYKMVGSTPVYGNSKAIVLNKKITVKIGKELQLQPTSSVSSKNYTWKSGNNKIATITKGGKVVAWNPGKMTITASTKNGVSAEYILTVPKGIPTKNPGKLKTSPKGTASYNLSYNNYSVWSYVVGSYLVQNSDKTLTRVEDLGKSILVETYSSTGAARKSTKYITSELSFFGGFYSGKDYNYMVFGQDNPNDSTTKEVMRVVKYSKAWKRISSVSIKGANTYIPFDAGSLRMTETGGKLYIHTCHEMFKSADGLHHQANMTYVIDEKTMKVKDSYYDVMNLSYGYVSHSFNQFIQTDGTYVYRVDHGDAYPRAISLTRFKVNDSMTNVDYVLPVSFANGELGDNATGASVGGFELSSESCVIAFNSINYKSVSASPYGTRNIYVASTNKDLSGIKVVKLTGYTDSSKVEVSTPQLVKIDTDRFMIMWEEYHEKTGRSYTRIATIDGRGTLTSDIVYSTVSLSDCQPILCKDGLVRWYVTDNSGISVYAINPYNLYFGKASSYIILPTPKVTSAKSTSSGIKLTWGKVSGAAQYCVFYKGADSKWVKIGSTTSNSFTWKGGTKGKKYTLSVCCLSKNGKFYTSYVDSGGKTAVR